MQSVICFSCACSHPLVPDLRANRLAFVAVFMGENFLGLSTSQVEEFFGKATYLMKYGKRMVRVCCTDLHASPFKEELEAWEVGVGWRGGFMSLTACRQGVQCSEHSEGRKAEHLCSKMPAPALSNMLEGVDEQPSPSAVYCSDQ